MAPNGTTHRKTHGTPFVATQISHDKPKDCQGGDRVFTEVKRRLWARHEGVSMKFVWQLNDTTEHEKTQSILFLVFC